MADDAPNDPAQQPPNPPPVESSDDEVDAHIEAGKPVDASRLQKRIRTITGERKELRAQLEASARELEGLRGKAGDSATLTTERDGLRGELDALRASHATERDLWRAGLHDEEGQEVARTLFGRLPEAERPKSIGEWLASFTGDKPAPRGLAPYLAPGGGAPKPAPPRPTGGSAAPPVNGEVTAQLLREATQAVLRGDPGAVARAQALSKQYRGA